MIIVTLSVVLMVKNFLVVNLDVGEAQAKILPLAQSNSALLIDLSQVGYMSSAGLRMMLLIYRQIGAAGGSVALTGLTEEIEEVMELTGFLTYFTTYESVDSAIEAMGS